MISSSPVDESSNEYCKNDVKCEKAATNHCQGCGQIYCIDHYLEHERKFQEHFDHAIHTQSLLRQKLKSLVSQLSTDAILDLIKQIYEFKMKLDEMEKTANVIQQQLQDLINEDKKEFKKQLITMKNGLESDHNGYLENDIECLRKDIEELNLKLEEINNFSQKRSSHEQLHIPDINVQSDNLPDIMKSPLLNLVSPNKKSDLQSVVGTLRNGVEQKANDTTVLSHLLLRQPSPSILDLNENEFDLTEADNETYLEEEEEEEMIEAQGSNTTPKVSQKIRLSNNIVRWLRGPFKIMVDGTMHAVDVCAQGTHISDAVTQAVKSGLEKQKQIAMEQQTTNSSLKPAFAEITPDWIFEGENSDRGFTSPSIWMRDPQGRRVLVKTQEHPLCAANERLAYTLGGLLGLPVNEVQIAIYQNELVTLHTDVSHENEKTFTFMDLPQQTRKTLLSDPTLECMDLFDHIIQNVDRNQRNILITMPNTTDIDDDTAKLKIHLIDHASCFGMGKLHIISIVASKFHSNHLSVVKFDPVEKARKFEQYLSKLPIADRTLIRKTLNRFAAITNDQFDSCIAEVHDLLSSSQYNRIHSVLRRQRDIARRYTIQWGICLRPSSVKPNQANQPTSETNDMETRF